MLNGPGYFANAEAGTTGHGQVNIDQDFLFALAIKPYQVHSGNCPEALRQVFRIPAKHTQIE